MGAAMAAAAGQDENHGAIDGPCCRFCGAPLSSAASHEGLARSLRDNGLLRMEAAIAAYSAVDRGDFVPEDLAEEAYLDQALVLGGGAQISAPHVHARALDLLAQRLSVACDGHASGPLVLDLGAGSGFMAAVLGRLLFPASRNADVDRGKVGRLLAAEHLDELTAFARKNIARSHGDLFAPTGPLELVCADMRELAGRSDLIGACDLVHCGAALEEPAPWLTALLRTGGRAVVPLGPTDAPQWLCTVDKLEQGGIEVTRQMPVLYVPATSAQEQRRRGECWDEVVDRCSRNSRDILLYDNPDVR
mmetsp:Transcript_52476/g.152752  ORF Transcript_52476/g.152752 Transcript_52476/m.152752 type:complete len:305 (-) Transcript_52476:27-941(-)